MKSNDIIQRVDIQTGGVASLQQRFTEAGNAGQRAFSRIKDTTVSANRSIETVGSSLSNLRAIALRLSGVLAGVFGIREIVRYNSVMTDLRSRVENFVDSANNASNSVATLSQSFKDASEKAADLAGSIQDSNDSITDSQRQLSDELRSISGRELTQQERTARAYEEHGKRIIKIRADIVKKQKELAEQTAIIEREAARQTAITARMQASAISDLAVTADTVLQRLREIARNTYTSLETTTEGFLRQADSLRELGYSTEQSLDFTEALNDALVVSGAKGERAASIIETLSKAMATGSLRGEYLNTVIRQGGRVTQLLAKELGISRNQLAEAGRQGLITGDIIYNALTKNMRLLRAEANKMSATIPDAFVVLKDAVGQFFYNLDNSNKILSRLSEHILYVADNFKIVGQAIVGVGAAMLVAFGPQMLGTVGALFTLLLRHPFTLLGGAVVALTTFFLQNRKSLPELIKQYGEWGGVVHSIIRIFDAVWNRIDEFIRANLIRFNRAMENSGFSVVRMREVISRSLRYIIDNFDSVMRAALAFGAVLIGPKVLGAVRLLFLTIARHPLGVLIIALASLAAYLSGSAEGSAFLAEVFTRLETIGNLLADKLLRIGNAILNFYRTLTNQAAGTEFKTIGEMIVATLDWIIVNFDLVFAAIGTFIVYIAGARILAAVNGFVAAINLMLAPLYALTAALWANPFVLALAGIALLGAALVLLGQYIFDAEGRLKSLDPIFEWLGEQGKAAFAALGEFAKEQFWGIVTSISQALEDLDIAVREWALRFINDNIINLETAKKLWYAFATFVQSIFSGQLDETVRQWALNFIDQNIISLDTVKAAWGGFKNFVVDVINSIISAIERAIAVARQLAAAISGRAAGGAVGSRASGGPVIARQGGGAVHGPGSSTSDSIMARLSTGEFVIKAAAVRKYGARLFALLNSMKLPRDIFEGYSLGGLVLPDMPTFQTGGAVAQKAMTPLTLNVGNETFADLLAPAQTADRIIRYAISKDIKSAGKKPRWFK